MLDPWRVIHPDLFIKTELGNAEPLARGQKVITKPVAREVVVPVSLVLNHRLCHE